MSFLIIFLKLLLVGLITTLYLLGKRFYKDYKALIATPDFEEMTIYGRLIVNGIFFVSIFAMIMVSLFSVFILISKVTIDPLF